MDQSLQKLPVIRHLCRRRLSLGGSLGNIKDMLHIPAGSDAPIVTLVVVASLQNLDMILSALDGNAFLLPAVEIPKLRSQRPLRHHQQRIGG